MTQTPKDPEFWLSKYQDLSMPWDRGGVAETLVEFWPKIDAYLIEDGDVFVPGCGRGHEAAFVAEKGLQTLALDYVSEAIDLAKDLYGYVSGLEFQQGDVLEVSHQSFRLIVDRAFLCAVPKEVRLEYRALLPQIMRPGGLYVSLQYYVEGAAAGAGPPFFIEWKEMDEYFGDSFEKIHHKESKQVNKQMERTLVERASIWRRI